MIPSLQGGAFSVLNAYVLSVLQSSCLLTAIPRAGLSDSSGLSAQGKPMESEAAWRYRLVFQYIDLSATTGWLDSTTVDTLHSFGTEALTGMVIRDWAGRLKSGPSTGPAGVI